MPPCLFICQRPCCPQHRSSTGHPSGGANAHQNCLIIDLQSFLSLVCSLVSLTFIPLSCRALLTPSIYPSLLSLLLPSHSLLLSLLSSVHSFSILSTCPNHFLTFMSTLVANSTPKPVLCLKISFLFISIREITAVLLKHLISNT